ncbi:hypothetical protein PR002_g16467 [Phytophthora rubi]|uniref:Retrotransposon gag domain-containing protein n=1 Tax=Phytophthora rubi TaxID=129364 RepID=A0A6A3KKZ0_9STRA|nr:hypothetical protein PR002_g16467 [Phytophthora rubi]
MLTEASVRSKISFEATPMVEMDECSVSCNSVVESSDAKDDEEDDDWKASGVMTETPEVAVVSTGRSNGVRPLARNLVEELDDVTKLGPAVGEDDDDEDESKVPAMMNEAPARPIGNRLPLNGDSPAANKVLGRCLEMMTMKSDWMRQFSPAIVRQAVWMDLGDALAMPIDSTSTRQVTRETELLLRAMGCEPQMYPSDMALADWIPTEAAIALLKLKKKLRSAFRMCVGCPPRLPAATEASVTTPNTRRVNSRRPSMCYDTREESSEGDDDYLGPDYHDGDLTREWAREVRDLSAVDNHSTTPRLKIATHLPLNSIEPFCGTHQPPNTWCVAFELSLHDGAQHWYWQHPRKTKRTWTLLSQAFIKYYCTEFTRSAKVRYYSAEPDGEEHVCDYLNRLNGYARNAGVLFEDGGRDAKYHVKHFLDTCDDRGLEERLCHVRVRGIRELEGIIDDILRYRERKSARESSLRRYRGQVDDLRREGRSTEGPRSGYHRERGFRGSDRHHVRPRITPLIEALTDVFAALKARGSDWSRTNSLDVRRHGYDTTDGCGNVKRAYECSQYSDEKSDDGYGSGPTHVRIESTTENEHRVATNGTLDVIRGMELLTPDGINLDLFHGTTLLSNQVMMHLQHRNESWVAEQPSVVDRQDYPTPRKIITRATEALTSGDECRTTSVEQNGLAPAVTDDLAGPGVHKPSVMVQEDALGHDDGEPTSSEDSNAYGPTADSRGSDDGGISPIDGSAKIFKPTQGFKTSGAVVVDRSRDGDEDYGLSEGWNDHGAELARPDTSAYSDDGATEDAERLLDAGYARRLM